MIKTQAIGHLGNDAIVNDVNGKKVINFSVAHSTKSKDQFGNAINHTLWVNCSWWTDKTNIVPYLKKGTLVYVEGIPSVDSYQNAQNVVVPQLRLRVASVQLLGSGQRSDNNQPAQTIDEPVDDLPF
ncbi:single-stranded DNA-binding protein [Pinibacter soli]|uniref:Single-stranded DNA-binding protein n=1 Tax=Pinibacter soli TaxID=3044211 RepID=A0ABT6RBN6_9BACT|nr:single-stranded DNA-binding protein [Pinibacter soli]MDI3319969.1 single-stranded DNA-binding protein [Pinibacter soli]